MTGSRRLASEHVVIASPMSLAGSAARLWRITSHGHGITRAGLVALALALVVVAWAAVLAWYAIFGIWLIPYRLLRRGQRKRKVAGLRHRETLARLGDR